MSQNVYEWVINCTGVLHVMVQALVFQALWGMFYPARDKGRILLAGALAGVNLLIAFWPGLASWIRYPLSAALALAYVFVRHQKRLEKAVFVLLLFYNLHGLSFLVCNSIHQYGIEEYYSHLDPASEGYLQQIYLGAAVGQALLVLAYGLLLWGFAVILGKMAGQPWEMGWQDTVFLSSLNVAGGMLARMVFDISMVETEQGVFLLFDEKRDMLWKIPLLAVLIYLGELAAVSIFQKYRELQRERQQHFVEKQQMKALERRLEEAEDFYGSIRKARHEMKNHMANLKGLAAAGNFQDAGQYMEKLEGAMGSLDYQFATGNPLTDVIINDKYRKAAGAGIDFQVQFCYGPEVSIPAFEMGILLDNLLDNAIEGCRRVEDGAPRYIRLSLKRKNHFLLLEVENSFDGIVRWEEGRPLPATRKQGKVPADSCGKSRPLPATRKQGKVSAGSCRKCGRSALLANKKPEGELAGKCGGCLEKAFPSMGGPKLLWADAEHGIGLSSVKEIAERYLGVMDIQINGTVFYVKVMLQQEVSE